MCIDIHFRLILKTFGLKIMVGFSLSERLLLLPNNHNFKDNSTPIFKKTQNQSGIYYEQGKKADLSLGAI